MIKVVYNENKIVVSGHANYDDYGKDIVCASVSSIINCTVNCIMNFDKDYISCVDNNEFIIDILVHNEVVDTIIRNMISLLKELELQYPKNIKICKGE